ncbi:MAG: hypothetical protein JNM85_03735 [Chthonomonas sp.]|nr:hypothetical protein [Chthonomonas sp.]
MKRYDGDSGAYLGEFGKGYFSQVDQIYADGSTGLAYVTDQIRNSVSVFNYSTGAFVREWFMGSPTATSVSSGVVRMADGNLAVTSNQTLFKYTLTGTLLATYTSTSSFYSITADSFGNVLAFTSGAQYIRLNSSLTVLNGPMASSSNLYGNGLFRSGKLFVADYSAGAVRSYTVSSGGTLTGGPTFLDAQLLSGALSVAAGHDQMIYSSGNAVGGGSSIYRTSTFSNLLAPQLVVNVPSGVSFRAVATVIAPEPTALLPLGIGAALLCRSRKQGSKK